VFDFLKKEWLLTEEKLHSKTEYYIENFIPKEGITMWYAKSGEGKTWFSLAVAKYILDHHDDVRMLVYMDFDNPRATLSDRNVELLMGYKNFNFIHRSTASIGPAELLASIGRGAYGENYKNCIFMFDAARDFVDGDMYNDTKVRAMMDTFKNIREAGGTVLINHHSTKNGKQIDGSGEFAKSLDALYRLRQNSKTDGKIHLDLDAEKERLPVLDQHFTVETKTMVLRQMDERVAQIDPEAKEFIDSVKEILQKSKNGLGQNELLTKMGLERSDRHARARLEEFTGVFWNVSQGPRKSKVYSAI
jgi:hypothetical protein